MKSDQFLEQPPCLWGGKIYTGKLQRAVNIRDPSHPAGRLNICGDSDYEMNERFSSSQPMGR